MTNGNQVLAMDDNDSVYSGNTNSRKKEENRKVIKATITIPLPKADIGLFKLRNNN
jgi:hypothetical protein